MHIQWLRTLLFYEHRIKTAHLFLTNHQREFVSVFVSLGENKSGLPALSYLLVNLAERKQNINHLLHYSCITL